MATSMSTQELLAQINAQAPSLYINSGNPSDTLASIGNYNSLRYENAYVPVENDAIASLDDTSILKDAGERTDDNSGMGRTKKRAAREAARYGLRRTSAQNAAADNTLALNDATGDADIMNEARLNQFDRNKGFRNELINIGRGVASDATANIANAAGMQTQRENAYRAAKAGAKAQNISTAATVASFAILAM